MSSRRLRGAVVIRTGSGSLGAMVPPYVAPTIAVTTKFAASDFVQEDPVSNRVYRVTEIVGTSPEGIDQAVRNGIERASRTLRHLDWFEVTQVRGQVKDGTVEHFQVGLKLGFRLEDD